MMDIEQRIAQIKSEIANAERIKAKAEIQREQATESLTKIVTKFREEYGVDSLDDAVELLNDIERRITDQLAEAEAKLTEFRRES